MTKHLHLYVVSLGALALMLTAVFIGSSGDAGAAPGILCRTATSIQSDWGWATGRVTRQWSRNPVRRHGC